MLRVSLIRCKNKALNGTNDMLVGLHVPTNFQMYRQKSEKALLGGGAIAPPPLPPLATLVGVIAADQNQLAKGHVPG